MSDTKMALGPWLLERAENAARIAAAKRGDDRAGWLEDEAYFRAAANAISEDTRLLDGARALIWHAESAAHKMAYDRSNPPHSEVDSFMRLLGHMKAWLREAGNGGGVVGGGIMYPEINNTLAQFAPKEQSHE